MNSTNLRGTQQRWAALFVIAGLIANLVIADLAYGARARVFFGRDDWMGDFIKHVMSFPGPPLAPSMYPSFIAALNYNTEANHWLFGHFHNAPETVLITLAIRPLMSLIDPVLLYMVVAAVFLFVWVYFVHRFADLAAKPAVLALAVLNYPLMLMLERGNLFAGITAICIIVLLYRQKLDWTAVIVMAVAVNIRPNVAILALPLFAYNRETLIYIVRTAIVGTLLGTACLIVDTAIYPAYTLSSWLHGLREYGGGYITGPLGVEFGSSLWGAVRHFVPLTGTNATICTILGLIPLAIAWLDRNRMRYPARCFLAIAALTLSTAVLADYHLVVFVLPLLLLDRDDPAFWPIFLGSCWMLIPKNYNPAEVLSWQTYLNPAGLIVAVVCIILAYRSRRAPLAKSESRTRPI